MVQHTRPAGTAITQHGIAARVIVHCNTSSRIRLVGILANQPALQKHSILQNQLCSRCGTAGEEPTVQLMACRTSLTFSYVLTKATKVSL